MKSIIKLFSVATYLILADFFAAGAVASCSNYDLTKCLDSACSVNIGLNPASRCQLCGTSSAGSAEITGMKSISVGTSSKNTISESDLKSAPTDPGMRYAWATGECIKKISGCTADDVSKVYDKLIEQSCKAAGITAETKSLTSSLKKSKSTDDCNAQIMTCLSDENSCRSDFSGCKDDADFNKFFAACAAQASGCDNSINEVRSMSIKSRDSAITNQKDLITKIVNSYKSKRESGLKMVNDACTNNQARETCIKTVCQINMKNKCASGYESEKSMATLLCGFYDTACGNYKQK
ncbi:MAG TPA: hypothetical protein PLZ05_02780 [Alphaproteobacteria bacterium]|nr:hypothetical protein [Alphaproteobacteria bacterium]